MSYLSIGEFAEAVGKTTQTIRNWDNSGYLKPAKIGLGGHRYYTQEQVDKYYSNKKIVAYCRATAQDEIEEHIKCVRNYCSAKGYQFEIITDIDSVDSLSRDGLNNIIDEAVKGEIHKIVILNKHVLADSAFEFLMNLCNRLGASIEIIESMKEGEHL